MKNFYLEFNKTLPVFAFLHYNEHFNGSFYNVPNCYAHKKNKTAGKVIILESFDQENDFLLSTNHLSDRILTMVISYMTNEIMNIFVTWLEDFNTMLHLQLPVQ